VANSGSQDISVFSIDASSGALTLIPQANGASSAPIGLPAINMALAPSGNVLYVTAQAALGYVEAFPVTAGVLGQPVQGSPFVTGNNPYGLAIDSSGTHLYTANKIDNSISEFGINTDGSLSPGSAIGETFAGPVSLLIDKSGKYTYVANEASSNLAAYSIGSDGSLTLLTGSPFGTGGGPSFLANDSSGNYLFVGGQSTIQSFSLDTSSGTLTSVASYPVAATATSIVITP
jgi:6-phosphogluconolactonase (cycloisomerase 2 family)